MPQFPNMFHRPKVFNRAATLAKLQGEVADLIKYENELAELQKQQMKKTLQNQVTQRIQKLSSLAEHINALAAQLEIETLNFKNIALETNRVYYAVQQPVDLKL